MGGWGGLEQGLNAANGLGGEEDIAANAANLCRHMVNDDHFTTESDLMDHRARFVPARASLNRALHG